MATKKPNASRIYVYSTLASDVAYTNHVAGGGDIPVALPPVLIRGGAGVANDRIITPQGVMTEVTGEQLDYLRENPVFKLHEENGYVLVSSDEIRIESAVADMNGRDESAPLVPQDLPKDSQPKAE